MLLAGAERVHVAGGATLTVQDMLLATAVPKPAVLR
jgi:hypothetical protein